MNQDCERFEPLLAQWADRSLDSDQAPEVDRHIAGCASCRASAAEQRDVHGALRAHVADLRESAPAGLRARVQRSAHPRVVSIAPTSTGRRRTWRLAAAAALVMAVLGAGALAPPGAVLAAQLAFDHLKCLWLVKEADSLQPEELEQAWAAEHGWSIDVPPSEPAVNLTLAGLPQWLFHGGRMAHVHYRHDGSPVSLFILPGARRTAPSLEIMGQQTVAWSGATGTYAVVAAASSQELAAIARYFQQQLR